MLKIKGMSVVIAVVISVFVISGQEAKAVEALPPDGPYHVGVRIEQMELEGRKTAVAVWYPAHTDRGVRRFSYWGKLNGFAVLNADPERGEAPYPLILFSHGGGGCGTQSIFYTENLASFGYVVVAPDHKDSAMCKIEAEPDITPSDIALAFLKGWGDLTKSISVLFKDRFSTADVGHFYRPKEASSAIDQALKLNQAPDSFLYGMIDPERIGVTGHSLGGFTTVILGGMPFDCRGQELPPGECELDDQSQVMVRNPCCEEAIRGMDPFQYRDKRVKAILPLAPALLFPDVEESAKKIEIPIMVISGGHKFEVPWEQWVWPLYENSPAPKYAVRVKKTDHFTIVDPMMALSGGYRWLIKVFMPGFRSHWKDKAQAYKDYSVAFFDLYLKGDHTKASILTSTPSNKFVELWSEVE